MAGRWGALRLVVAATGLAVTASACGTSVGVGGADAWRRPVSDGDYAPLTEGTFAAVTTAAMHRYGTAHIDMSLVDFASTNDQRMSMDVRYGEDTADLEMSGTVRSADGSGLVVLVGGEVYVREDGRDVFYQFPDRMADRMIAQMGMSSPLQVLIDFSEGIESLRYTISQETSSGEIHRYQLTMRTDYMADQLDVPEAEVPDFSYIMWLDDDHLMRRMEADLMGLRVGVSFSDWGEPVTIEAPPADEVKPLPLPHDTA